MVGAGVAADDALGADEAPLLEHADTIVMAATASTIRRRVPALIITSVLLRAFPLYLAQSEVHQVNHKCVS